MGESCTTAGIQVTNSITKTDTHKNTHSSMHAFRPVCSLEFPDQDICSVFIMELPLSLVILMCVTFSFSTFSKHGISSVQNSLFLLCLPVGNLLSPVTYPTLLSPSLCTCTNLHTHSPKKTTTQQIKTYHELGLQRFCFGFKEFSKRV